jgi:hypothetical protein
VALTTHTHLTPSLRKSRFIHPFSVGLLGVLQGDLYPHILHFKLQSQPQNVYLKSTHILPGTDTKSHPGHNTQNYKLNYTINIPLIRKLYGTIVEHIALKTTLGTTPSLAIMLHTGSTSQCPEKAKYLLQWFPVSIYRWKN